MNIINKKVAAVVLGLGVALGAQASQWSNSSPGLVDVTANETGTTTFTYDELSGPVSIIAASVAGQTVRCAPPSAIAASSRSAPRRAIAAADEAHVPVPDEVVGPHPRS